MLSNRTKQYISGLASVLAVVAISSCIGQMIPYGLAGETGKVMFWFALMMGAVAVGCVTAIAYYYYRSRMIADQGLTRMRAEVNALAGFAESMPKKSSTSPVAHPKQRAGRR